MISISLSFKIPSIEQIRLLLNNQSLMTEYDITLALIHDFLMNYAPPRGPHPYHRPEESNRRVKELLSNEELVALSDNLLENHAMALVIRNEQNEALRKQLAERFLDELTEWQGVLSDAESAQDEQIVVQYLKKKSATKD